VLKRFEFLQAAENRETFFRRISFFFPTTDWRYRLILKAYDTAKDAFRGKYRDDGKTRYFEHIRAVALILLDYLRVRDYRLIVAALLHDIVEDIPSWTIERVEVEFGLEVALLVEYMTKPSVSSKDKSESDDIYNSRFRFAPRSFFLLKLADRLHNLLTLWNCTKEKRTRKIEETKKYYLPYAEQHFILYYEILDAIDMLEK
jgi:guanosine-3',5'-bis(diphosphate) 3'-pyrophosphohydrolase